MPSEDELEQVSTLQALMPFTPDYCCEKCGAILSKPTVRVFGYHIAGGTPMLAGKFTCPNRRWWNTGHTVLLLEYVNGNLDISSKGKFFGRLWVHKLEEARIGNRGRQHS